MNQIKLLFSLFLLSSLALTSCLRDVELNSNNSTKNQLVVIAELEEGISPQIRISTTFEVTSSPLAINGDSTFVTLTESESNFEALREFRPLGNDPSLFWLPAGLTLTPGESFILTVEAPNPGVEPLYGETTMPLRGSIDNSTVESVIENDDYTELAVSINLGDTPDISSYYHLSPYVIDNSGSKIFPDVSKISSGDNACTILTHRDGILIDISSLDNTNLLEFHLRSLLPLDINQLSDKNLYFKLNTVAEEYYLYHQSVSRQFETNQSPFTIPTLSYSQFENGYGIFTAFSSEIFESPIN